MPRSAKASPQGSAQINAPVRRPGRPSIALARRAEIIEAYVECIRAHGMSGATVDELAACFPKAGRGQCEWVGYALTCLGEQHWWLTFIGPGARRRDDARRAAESLIATLQSGDAE